MVLSVTGRRGMSTPASLTVVGGTTGPQVRHDRVVTEEPLEVRACGPGKAPRPITVTMRTPGHDFELAVGFLRTEGIVRAPSDVRSVQYCDLAPGDPQLYNIVTVRLGRRIDDDASRRTLVTSSSCGLCGTESLERLAVDLEPIPLECGLTISADMLVSLPERLRAHQATFDKTGGLHAAGLFSADGDALVVREDVGRHNAVDKVIGRCTLDRRPDLLDHVLVVSGRTSFEIVQKAAMAAIPIIASVSAPSSLAVEAAERFGLTLVGFVRDGRANVYAHPSRIGP